MANAIAYRENCQSGDDLASGIGEGMHEIINRRTHGVSAESQ